MANRAWEHCRLILRLRYTALVMLRSLASLALLAAAIAGAIRCFGINSQPVERAAGLIMLILLTGALAFIVWFIAPRSFRDMRESVAGKTKSSHVIENLAMHDADAGVRIAAVKHVASPALLCRIARDEKDPNVISACIQRILIDQKKRRRGLQADASRIDGRTTG